MTGPQVQPHFYLSLNNRGQLKCDGTRAEIRFRLSAKRASPLRSPDSPSLPLPCVTVCHHLSIGVYLPNSLVLTSHRSTVTCYTFLSIHMANSASRLLIVIVYGRGYNAYVHSSKRTLRNARGKLLVADYNGHTI